MSVAYNAVTVTTAATKIMAANPGRRGYIIANNSSQTIYVGPDASITTSNAIPIAVGSNITDSGDGDNFKSTWYGIVAATTADVRYMEWTA